MSAPPSPTLSDSALLDSLEDDPRFDLVRQREMRMDALKSEVGRAKRIVTDGYGVVNTVEVEERLIKRMAKEKYCILHFFHPEFAKCRIMDQRLSALAPAHTHTLFLRTSVLNAPFLVEKFKVQTLPCVVAFVDGKPADVLIGFEHLGNKDDFSPAALEFRLRQCGVLPDLLTLQNVGTQLFDALDGSDGEYDRETRTGHRRGKTKIRNGLASAGDDDDV